MNITTVADKGIQQRIGNPYSAQIGDNNHWNISGTSHLVSNKNLTFYHKSIQDMSQI